MKKIEEVIKWLKIEKDNIEKLDSALAYAGFEMTEKQKGFLSGRRFTLKQLMEELHIESVNQTI